MKFKFLVFGTIFMALANPAAWGAVIYDVAFDTSDLIGHIAGPFSIEMQFNDGSGTGDGNNIAALSLFDFGSGNGIGSPTLIGGVAGDLGSSIAMTDSSFFNEFIQSFSAGSTLSFRLSLTTNLDAGGTPDEFSFSILDSSGVEIPTLDFSNALIVADIDSASPSVLAFSTDPRQNPNGGGPPISIAAPEMTVVSASTPEPSTIVLLGSGFLGLGLGTVRRRTRNIVGLDR
jgi:hypothetical protein